MIDSSTKSKSTRPLRLFLCHASQDKSPVRALYQRLRNDGFKPWLDEEDLLPGQEWEQEIRKAVRTADIVMVCLSNKSVTKTGFIQKEIRLALDVADAQPEGTLFIIPVRLEECIVPDRLRRWQWVDLFEQRGYDRLVRAVQLRVSTMIIPVTTTGQEGEAANVTQQLPQSNSSDLVNQTTTTGVSGEWQDSQIKLATQDSSSVAGQDTDSAQLSHVLKSGIEAYNRRSWLECIEHLEQVLELEPTNEEAATVLAQAQQQQALSDLQAEAQRLRSEQAWEAHAIIWSRITNLKSIFPHLIESNPQHPLDVPYPIRLTDDIKTHQGVFDRLRRQGKHIMPHAADIASIWAILTRIESPRAKDLTLLEKFKLYNGLTLPGFSSKDIDALREESPSDGFIGIAPSYIHDAINNLFVRFPEYLREPCVTPWMIMHALEQGLERYKFINDEDRNRYINLFGLAKTEYTEIASNEVQLAVVGGEHDFNRQFAYYIVNLKSYIQKDSIYDYFTGHYQQPDEQFMRLIEEKIDINEANKDAFRREVMSLIGAAAIEGCVFDYKTYQPLYRALLLSLLEHHKGWGKLISLASQANNRQVQETIDIIRNRLIRDFGYCADCSISALQFIAHIHLIGPS